MIDSFRDDWLREFYVSGSSHKAIPASIRSALARKLDVLRFAVAESDLATPPGNRFERLKGNLAGWCSIRVNRQYRLIFEWRDSRAIDVYLDPIRTGDDHD